MGAKKQLQFDGVVAEQSEVEVTHGHEHNEPADAPKDKFHLAYLIFLLQGTGVLLPWNAFISAPAYFTYFYGSNIEFYLSLAYSYPNLLGVVAMVFIGNKIPLKIRILVSQIVCLIVIAVVPVLPYVIDPCNHQSAALGITLSLVVIMALASAVFQGGLFGFAGFFPANYTQALMSGNGVAGVLVSALTAITTGAFISQKEVPAPPGSSCFGTHSSGDNTSAGIYFGIGAAVLLLCVISFIILLNLPYVKRQFAHHEERSATSSAQTLSEESKPLFLEEGHVQEASRAAVIKSKASGIKTVFKVMLKNWWMEFNVFFVFFISLGVFPGIATLITTTSLGPNSKVWAPIIMISLFNVFDWAGRTLPRWLVFLNKKTLGIVVIARVIFVPLFILSVHPNVLHWFWLPCIIMAFMAFTNGYCSSIAMMYGPDKADEHEKETAGQLMTFFLLFGIAMGSNLSLLIKLVFIPKN